MEVREVVHAPGREQLAERDDAELRMPAAVREVLLAQVQRREVAQALRAQLREFIEQLRQ